MNESIYRSINYRTWTIAALAIILTLVATGCQGSNRPYKGDLAEMLIGQADLPAGWSIVLHDQTLHFVEGDAAQLQFEFNNDGGNPTRGYQVIYRYRSNRDATEMYRFHYGGSFERHESRVRGERTAVGDRYYVQAMADDAAAGCQEIDYHGITDNSVVCTYLARYGNIVASLQVDTTLHGKRIITDDELQDLANSAVSKVNAALDWESD